MKALPNSDVLITSQRPFGWLILPPVVVRSQTSVADLTGPGYSNSVNLQGSIMVYAMEPCALCSG